MLIHRFGFNPSDIKTLIDQEATRQGILTAFEEKDWAEGTLKLIDWLKKAEPYYHKSVPTIKRWFGEIVGDFQRRTTNGIVEGINNKLKLLKHCGFGFRNFNNFETRALLFWHFPKSLAH